MRWLGPPWAGDDRPIWVMWFVGVIEGTKSPLFLPPSADQYLGRCETAHCRACSMGACGGNAARNFRIVGCASILSRHRQKAGYLGYMAWPSLVSPKAYVLGSTYTCATVH